LCGKITDSFDDHLLFIVYFSLLMGVWSFPDIQGGLVPGPLHIKKSTSIQNGIVYAYNLNTSFHIL
jgi:hypothetical protein